MKSTALNKLVHWQAACAFTIGLSVGSCAPAWGEDEDVPDSIRHGLERNIEMQKAEIVRLNAELEKNRGSEAEDKKAQAAVEFRNGNVISKLKNDLKEANREAESAKNAQRLAESRLSPLESAVRKAKTQQAEAETRARNAEVALNNKTCPKLPDPKPCPKPIAPKPCPVKPSAAKNRSGTTRPSILDDDVSGPMSIVRPKHHPTDSP
jgi:hypothetical protein